MVAPASAPPAGVSYSQSEDGVRKQKRLGDEGKGEPCEGKINSNKYIPLYDVYSVTSPCVTATGSKKVKAAARKPPKINGHDQFGDNPISMKSCITMVYSRRCKNVKNSSFHGMLNSPNLVSKSEGLVAERGQVEISIRRTRVEGGIALVDSGVFDKASSQSEDQIPGNDKSATRELRKKKDDNNFAGGESCRKRKKSIFKTENISKSPEDGCMKKWARLNFEDEDPKKFVGLPCKVYWPLDDAWYRGHVAGYNSETGRHMVNYEDGDEEYLSLSNEQIKFHVSVELMKSLKLKIRVKCLESDRLDVNEMTVLAASLDDSQEIDTGDVIWAKLTGHADWPAIVLDESHVSKHKDLNKVPGEKLVLVQFFGTHDFARVKPKQASSFLKGLVASCHSKCNKPTFIRGLEEAKMYLSEQRLPERMLKMRHCDDADVNNFGGDHQDVSDSSDKEWVSTDELRRKIEDLKSCPLGMGDLRIITLGKIVKDSSNFQNDRFIWPEGYTATRKFPSVSDPSTYTLYKMEVLRDPTSRIRPLFRVTTDTGEEFNGSTPSSCWSKIFKRIRVVDNKTDQPFPSGSSMFGFSHPKISKVIKEMSDSLTSSKLSQATSRKTKGLPVGYRRVHVEWRDLDKCNVCHMDEEYESNLFLQCDKCRMMVHARCYGELETIDDALWLCRLCRPGAPENPPCCLCPVGGGAMKPTTDGRWAHLACAIWIPETCLSDIKKMEPIDGISRIKKDRWKLLCSICNVSHGACIQCSNNNCRVSYHPLCARAAGFCLETENKDMHLVPACDDEENQCIQLLSFCKKHRPLSIERLPFNQQDGTAVCENSNYIPPANPSGCARTEPYNFLGKRQTNKSEVPAASVKRLYVENAPYLLGGCSPHMPLWDRSPNGPTGSVDLQKLRNFRLEPSVEILSVVDKYNFMRETFRKRLAFGKSRIHGFGVFTKFHHRAGDMVIEYTGELIRPVIADRREHLIYNSLVGAGTYMFRIDDEHVIDATRAGSIAQLINHSCEPNCYSRVISVNGNDHIIIFAKRDLKQWEELTYDYRFFSSDQKLVCRCGSSRCRGVVNDVESEELAAKQYVPRSELIDWQGE